MEVDSNEKLQKNQHTMKDPQKTEKELELEKQAARQKELKAMKASDLKELATRIGLDSTQKKDDLAENVVAHEAKLRADALARAEKMRAVVVQKKEELEGLTISDLAKLCATKNIEGARSKEERVVRLLKQWQDCNGVMKALEQECKQERAKELGTMDSLSLRRLCQKN